MTVAEHPVLHHDSGVATGNPLAFDEKEMLNRVLEGNLAFLRVFFAPFQLAFAGLIMFVLPKRLVYQGDEVKSSTVSAEIFLALISITSIAIFLLTEMRPISILVFGEYFSVMNNPFLNAASSIRMALFSYLAAVLVSKFMQRPGDENYGAFGIFLASGWVLVLASGLCISLLFLPGCSGGDISEDLTRQIAIGTANLVILLLMIRFVVYSAPYVLTKISDNRYSIRLFQVVMTIFVSVGLIYSSDLILRNTPLQDYILEKAFEARSAALASIDECKRSTDREVIF